MGQRVILFSDQTESRVTRPEELYTLHSRLLFFVDDATPINLHAGPFESVSLRNMSF